MFPSIEVHHLSGCRSDQMLPIGFTMVTQLDASNTLVQRIVPDELRGRVIAIEEWEVVIAHSQMLMRPC